MVPVRRGVFETASSSVHILYIDHSIPSSDVVLTTLPYREVLGIARAYIAADMYGWGLSFHNDAATKASYLLTQVKMGFAGEEHRLLSMLSRYMTEKLGKPCEVVDETENIGCGFGIDHQSLGEADALLNGTYEDIINFVFNPRCTLTIGNDNDDMMDFHNENLDRVLHEEDR